MRKTGVAELPLHYGSCPRWLFSKMVNLGKVISEIIIDEFGKDEYLRRLSNPFFFQALGCVLGFDFHSSGLTITTCAALKKALNLENFGIMIAGGKGKFSRKTPDEIMEHGEKLSISTKKIEKLIYASRLSAKVDNSLIQDGYQLYHHCFILTEDGKWAVIQQGLNEKNGYARRFHWLSENVTEFINEPHNAICCNRKEENVLNMVSSLSKEGRKISLDLVRDGPKHIERCAKLLMERKHSLTENDFSERVIQQLEKAYQIQPENYEELVALKGFGPKCIRALALISQLIYGAEIDWRDPAKFSFAHGGKDGYPRPVETELMEKNVRILNEAIKEARLNKTEKLKAIKRLKEFIN